MELVLPLIKICKMKKVIKSVKENYTHQVFQIWLKDFYNIFMSIRNEFKNSKNL